MEISDDFYLYFERFGRVLEADGSLFCISAYNQLSEEGAGTIGKNISLSSSLSSTSLSPPHPPSFPSYPSHFSFARSDSFLGRGGWMTTKKLWEELKKDHFIEYTNEDTFVKWPIIGRWRDWLSMDDQRKDRDCIYPELSRVRRFEGEKREGGENWKKGGGGREEWERLDLVYLMEGEWKKRVKEEAVGAERVRSLGDIFSYPFSSSLLFSYSGEAEVEEIEKGLLGGVKGGLGKYSYDGVLYLRVGGGREGREKIVWLVPRGRGYSFKQPSWMAPLSLPPTTTPAYPNQTVMIITCYNRPNYLQKTLENVFKYLPPEVRIVILLLVVTFFASYSPILFPSTHTYITQTGQIISITRCK